MTSRNRGLRLWCSLNGAAAAAAASLLPVLLVRLSILARGLCAVFGSRRVRKIRQHLLQERSVLREAADTNNGTRTRCNGERTFLRKTPACRPTGAGEGEAAVMWRRRRRRRRRRHRRRRRPVFILFIFSFVCYEPGQLQTIGACYLVVFFLWL